MPDELNYPTAHDIARKLLEGPDLPLFDRHSEYRVIDVSIHEKYNRVCHEDMDEHGNPCSPEPDQKYYYLVRRNDPDDIYINEFGKIQSFGNRQLAEEYLKNDTWVIKETTTEEFKKLYYGAAQRTFLKKA